MPERLKSVACVRGCMASNHAERDTDADLTPADRVVVSYPEDLSDWGRFQVEKPSFVAFLRKTRTDRVRQGDESAWADAGPRSTFPCG